TVGTAYNQSIAATGGTLPYAWSVESGALPPGLSLSASGVISGAPSVAGSYTFTIRVTAASNSTASQSFSLTIAPQAGVSTAAFLFPDRGGFSATSAGASSSINIGYASIQPNAGSTTPAGLAIFGFRQNNILVSEAGVPASSLLQAGRIYAEVNGPVNTGL